MSKCILSTLNIHDAKQITVGYINEVYSFDNKTKIIKINKNKSNLESEYKSLLYLKENGFNIPQIYQKTDTYMITEYINQDECPDIDNKKILFSELYKLHSITNNKFGFYYDTFSAIDQMSNEFSDRWDDFFKINRWKKLFDLIRKDNIDFEEDYNLGMAVFDIIPKVFEKYEVVPSLLHGDLNPNNFLIKDGKVYFIDCACFYGDKMYDLACFNLWKSDTDDNPINLLYYSFIMSSVYRLTGTRLNKAKQFMKKLLLQFPICYPSLVMNISNYDYEYIIVQGGSYNPVHNNHIKNMIIASKHISQEKTLLVFALASDERVKAKCKNKIEQKSKFYHRKHMLDMAIKKEKIGDSCIDLTGLWGTDIIKHYRNLMTNVKKIYVCCGLDTIGYHFNDIFDCDQTFLVINRNKYKAKINDDRIIYLDNESEKTMSSSMIRKKQSKDIKDFMNNDVYSYYIDL